MTRLALFALLSASLVGCSSSSSVQPTGAGPGKEAVLHEVGEMIRLYSGEAGQGPRKAADLAKYEGGYPLGYAAVHSGEVVVVWGAKMAGEGEAASAPANVVAYEKKAETDGGLVLLQNGQVKPMKADELKAAPKAK